MIWKGHAVGKRLRRATAYRCRKSADAAVSEWRLDPPRLGTADGAAGRSVWWARTATDAASDGNSALPHRSVRSHFTMMVAADDTSMKPALLSEGVFDVSSPLPPETGGQEGDRGDNSCRPYIRPPNDARDLGLSFASWRFDEDDKIGLDQFAGHLSNSNPAIA